MNALFASRPPGENRSGAPESYNLDHLSRREFLRQCQKGLLGLFTLPLIERAVGKEKLVFPDPTSSATRGSYSFPPDPQNTIPLLGRVLDDSLSVYKEPTTSSKLVKMYWRDLVFPISAATIGEKEPEHNRVWYLINHEGYAHSGKVQPVAIHTQTALESVPEKGALMEVTVPFTDGYADPNRPDWFVYRLYYGTTHWVDRVASDKQGQKWYHIRDDKFRDKEYYVNGTHLRPVLPEDLTTLSPSLPDSEKRVEVRLGDQVLIAYESGKPIFMTRIASGAIFISGNYTTPVGTFITSRKRPSRHMASGDLAAPSSFDLPGVPWVSYLTLRGVSFHGTYWHNDFGKTRSHGCVNLTPEAARWIYRWTLPNVPDGLRILEGDTGTRVDVID